MSKHKNWGGFVRGLKRKSATYREPGLTQGEPAALPEKRPEVLERLIRNLEEQGGAYRQEYSNGEFISSSLCVARSMEQLQTLRALENPEYVAHYDAALNVWWRRGGCSD